MLESPEVKKSDSHLAKEDIVGGRKEAKNDRYSNNHSPERPHSRGVTTIREQESMIGELKKECFGLKLRIYYMEEQLRDTFDTSVEDILKENVELKVAVEELKNEIVYKTDLLTKASQAMQQMSGENDNQFHHMEYKENFDKLKNDYRCKLDGKDEQIKKLEEELNQLNRKLDGNKNGVDKENKLHRLLEREEEKYKLMVVKKQQDEDSLKTMIHELEQTLATKEGNIEMLRNDVRRIASNNTDRGGQHYKALYEKLGKTLSDKESDLVQLKTELTCKSNLVDSFKDHIASLEQGLKCTRDASEEKDLELQMAISQLHEQVKKLQCAIQEKEDELQAKDKALTEAKEEKLLAHQQKVQYELDSVKNKDSHIIELEIKLKQQNVDLEKYIEEHNRSVKEKENVLKLQGKYAAAQQEIKRMKIEEKEYESLIADLKNSLQKSMEKERNVCLNLDNLLSKSNEQKESETIASEFIKNLKQQLKDKDVLIQEIKAMKEEAVSSASLKHKELEAIIVDLKNDLTLKTNENNVAISEENPDVAPNVTKHNNLVSALLKDKNAAKLELLVYQSTWNEKEEVIQALTKSAQDKDKEISKMTAVNDDLAKKNEMVESLNNQLKELRKSLQQIESEKVNLEIDLKTVKITKESFRKQLEDAYSQLSKKDTDSEVKESTLTSELGELSKVFESVIETYKLLMEKLNNNQHPDSQLHILQHELTEVGHTRENFQLLLHAVLDKFPIEGDIHLSNIVNKDKALKIQLGESRMRNSSLEEQLNVLAGSEHKVVHGNNIHIENSQQENELLKVNIKQLTEQMAKMKFEYEEVVCERENEISMLMKNMNEENQVNELLTQRKELDKKGTQDTAALKNTKTKLAEKNSDKLLDGLLQNKENCILEMQKQMSLLQSEKGELSCKLEKKQTEVDISKDNLNKVTSDLESAQLNMKSLETQLSEKRKLKKDVKDLFEMNVRLRKKVKAYALVITKKDTEKGKLKEELEKAEDTNKKLEDLLNNSNEKTALEGELQHLRTKIKNFDSLDERYSSLQSNNINLQEKVDELLKINEFHEGSTLPELKKMSEMLDVFREENITLKSDLQKANIDKDRIMEKHLEELDELRNENHKLLTIVDKQLKEMNEKASDIMSLQNALQKQSETVTEKVSDNTKLQNLLEEKSREISEKANDITNLHHTLQKRSKEMDEKTVDIKNLKSELQQMRETLEDYKLTDKLTSELIESKSIINSLKSQIDFCSGNHGDVTRLKEEIKHLKDAKLQLKENNRKLKESAGEMSQKLSTTLDENNMKLEEIKVLRTQMLHLEEKIESFSPLYTSSAHNIALSSDAFTQTQADDKSMCIIENSDSLIVQHIKEMQQLRKQLEETINNNDSLRIQLEERLSEVEQDVSLLHDPQLRITLIRDNDAMRMKLTEADTNQKKLKLQIEKLNEEKENHIETINSLHSQMHELNVISTNLKLEMEVYDRLIQQLGINKNKQFTNEDLSNLNHGNDLDKNLLLALLEEIRDLRDQLQLTIDVNNQLREKLEKELGHPLPVETFKTPRKSHLSPRSLFSGAVLRSINTNSSRDTSVAQNTQSLADYTSLDETPTKDRGIDGTPVGTSWCAHNQAKSDIDVEDSYVVSVKVKDFEMLKKVIATVIDKVATCFKKLKSHKENSMNIVTDIAQIQKLLKELPKLLSTFFVSENNDNPEMDVKDNNTSEFEIATKLLKACDTLKTTKGNLQLRTSRPPSRNNSPNN